MGVPPRTTLDPGNTTLLPDTDRLPLVKVLFELVVPLTLPLVPIIPLLVLDVVVHVALPLPLLSLLLPVVIIFIAALLLPPLYECNLEFLEFMAMSR